ncbi:MAG: MurR/RpiR family transcriptional regulator [Coprobacillaceae bacterium]
MDLFRKLQEMQFTNTERIIADFTTHNPLKVLEMTTRTLADATYTSPMAVTRFCKKLGVGGFLQFKLLLSSEIGHMQNAIHVDDILPIKEYDTAYNVIAKIKKIQIAAIEETANKLDYNLIQKIVQLMMNADQIDIYGLGINYYIAEEIKYLIGRLDKKVVINDSKNERYAQVLSSNEKHIAFVLTHTGEEKEQLKIAKLIQNQGTKIISLTGDENSSLAKISDYNIYIKPGDRFVDMGPIVFSTSTRYVLDTIFGYMFTFVYRNNKEKFDTYAKLTNYENK